MHSTEKKALALNLLLSLLMAAGWHALFAYNNTPLGAAIGATTPCNSTTGTALAKGWALYVSMCLTTAPPALAGLQWVRLQWIGVP